MIARQAVHRAGVVDQLVRGVVRLAARAVRAFVRAAIQVAAGLQSTPQVERDRLVLGLGRANEAVVLDVEALPQRFEGGGELVGVLLR